MTELQEWELSLVQAAYTQPELTSALDVRPEDFEDGRCRKAWETLTTLHIEGMGADLVVLQERSGLPAAWVAALTDGAGLTANASYYADRVRRASLKRAAAKVIAAANEHIRNGSDGAEVVAELQSDLMTVLRDRGVAGFQPVQESLMRVIDFAERAYRGDTGRISTTLYQLDQLTCGMYPGELVILGARTSVGKSAMAVQMAADLAAQQVPTGVISLEMTADSMMRRLIASRARIDSAHLREPKDHLSTGDFSRIQQAASEIAQLPLYVSDRGSQTLADITLTARAMQARHHIKLLVVDYLTLVRPRDPRMERWIHVGEVTAGLKELAKRAELVVLCPAQLSRRADESGVPRLSDLRESGNIEQDADQIWLLHRQRDTDGLLQSDATLTVAKHREGSTGTVRLRFVAGWTRFEEVIQQ